MKWPVATIGEVCEVVSGATPKTDNPEFWDGDVPWVTPKDLSQLGQKYLSDTHRRITKAGLKSCSARMLPAQSVLLSSRAPIGLVAINTLPVCTNQGFKSLVPRIDLVWPDFLFWWLRAQEKHIQSKGRGATFKEVSKKIVEDLQLPIPPLDEQKRIAEILDKADALRAKRRATLAQLDTLIQSIFLDMFGDPTTNPKGWPVVLLGESTARIQIGPFGSLLHQEDYVDGGIPLVNPKHIQQGTIQPDLSETVSARKFAELDTYHLKAGDVVMGRRGEMGRCAIVNEGSSPLLCGTGSLFVRPDNEHTTSLFLLFLLSSAALKARLERLSLGQTLSNLNSQIVEGLEVPLPPLAVQLEFAVRVEGAYRLVNAQSRAASQLSSLFASLQQRAFRGEL